MGLDGPHWALMGKTSVGWALGGSLFGSLGQTAMDLALGGLFWRGGPLRTLDDP